MNASSSVDGLVSQAWGGTNPNGVHVNVVLAERGSATAATMTGAFSSPNTGYAPILACVGEDQPSYETVYPPTIMLNKTASATERHAGLVSGACQVGIAQGVLDAVADRAVAADQDTLVFVAVWLNPDADDGIEVCKAAREAAASGIGEATTGHDRARALVADRDRLTHPFFVP